jgi:DNA-binding transcriptional MerR regulator
MLSMGDFARFAGVSVRMLRHYDSLGLLVPAYVDPTNGYRHYATEQFRRIERLRAVNDLGFTLEQVGLILDAEIGLDELRGMLLLRKSQIEVQIDADRARLSRIEARIHITERETRMSELTYTQKPLPGVLLAQLTDEVGSIADIGGVVGPMFARLVPALAGAGIALQENTVAWYETRDDRMGLAAALPITEDVRHAAEGVSGVTVGELSAAQRAVTVVHLGAMDTITQTWQTLAHEVETHGLRPVGRSREVYLEAPQDNPDAWVTELQQPVEQTDG